MKNVLWVSRHEMTTGQREDLQRILADDFTTEVIGHTIKTVDEIVARADEKDIIAVVLPPQLTCNLLKEIKDQKVIQSVSKRIEVPNPETGKSDFIFVHDRWEHIVKLDIEVATL